LARRYCHQAIFFKNAGQANSATGDQTVDATDAAATDSTPTADNADGDADITDIYMNQEQLAASTPLKC